MRAAMMERAQGTADDDDIDWDEGEEDSSVSYKMSDMRVNNTIQSRVLARSE